MTANDFDARGLPAWTSMPFYNTAEPGTGAVNPLATDLSRTQTTYDVLERPTTVGFYTPTQSPKWATTTSYGGDRSTVTPPVGGTKTTIADTGGRTTSLVEQTDTGTTTTSYGYNRRGEMTSFTDVLGNVTRYTYDLLGNRLSADDPDAGNTAFTYYDSGQLRSSTDARDKTITSTYDELGRKKAVFEGSETGIKRAEWLYDSLPLGRGLPVSSTAFNDGSAYTSAVIGYDATGRATGTSVTIPPAEGNLAGTYTFGVTHDDAGRIATTTYPQAGGIGAETVTSIYNGIGLPATLTGVINGVSKPYVTATSFTQLGQLAKRYTGSAAGEARRTYTYETDTGRLATVMSKSGTALTTVQDDRYTYDAIGNATRVAEHNAAGALAVAECFSYDKLNRLTQAFTTTAATCASNPAAGTANGVEPYHLGWTYNDIGNRITETNKLTASPVTRTSGYPTSGATTDRPHAPTSVTTTGDPTPDTATYDAAGNTDVRTIDGLTGDFTWDAFGRLDHADIQRTTGIEQTSYLYDAEGQRLLRKEPSATTLYLDGMELKLTTAGTGTGTVNATRYYSHGGAPIAARTASNLTWILNDTQASAEIAVDATTGTTTRRRYLPFGADRSPNGIIQSWPTDRGFLNKTKDTSTGLTHLGAREYDTTNGRFLTPDPLATPTATQNTAYGYSANNPVTYSDPSGLSPEDAQFWVNKPASAEKHSRAAKTTRYGKARTYNRSSASSVGSTTSANAAERRSPSRNTKRILERGIDLGGDLVIAPTPEILQTWLNRAEADMCSWKINCDRSDENFDVHAHRYICSDNPTWCGAEPGMVCCPTYKEMGIGSGVTKLLGKALPAALRAGRNTDEGVDVYIATRNGKDVYAGLTNNLERRAIEHGGAGKNFDRLRSITTQKVSRGEARAIEQALIKRNPSFENVRNSISPKHAYYDDAVEWGEAWLKSKGL